MIWKQFTHLGHFPPELKARFNSFLTTEFDDSVSVEMQLRSVIKWCQGNFKTVDTLIDFINELSNWLKQFENSFDTKLEDSVISVLSEWQASGQLDDVINEVLQWQLDDYIATNEQDKLSLTAQLQQTEQNINAQLAQTIKQGEATVSDINKNKGLFDETYFTPEVKAQWSGTSPISTVVADESVTTSKLVNKAVTKEKVNTFIKDSIYQVENYISKGILPINKKNLYNYRLINSEHETLYSTWIGGQATTKAGTLTVRTRTHKSGNITVNILERNKNTYEFRKVDSQTFTVDIGTHVLETNLIIEVGQYVGLESNYNFFYLTGENLAETFSYVGVPPTTNTVYTRQTNIDVGFYYEVGKVNQFEETLQSVNDIVTSRKKQGEIPSSWYVDKRQSNDGGGTIRIRDLKSQVSGKVELVIDLATTTPFRIFVMDKQGLNFSSIASETITPTKTGEQSILTNLDIEKGQYVGIETKSNIYYYTPTKDLHYLYVGNPIQDTYILYDESYNIGLFYYYNVVNIGRMEKVERQIENIEVFEPIERAEASYLYNKTLYMFGDSITYWDSPTINEVDRGRVYDVKGLASHIRERLGATVYNHGVGGEVAKQITDRLVATDLSNVDAITYSSGSNDVANGVVIGTINDLTTDNTFCGNVKRAIENAYRQNPLIRIYLFTPHKNFTGNRDVRPCVNATVEIGKLYGIPVFNAFELLQLNTINASVYMPDNLHFYASGYELFADGFIPFLTNH